MSTFLRFGVIGLGNMGSHHVSYLAANGVEGAKLAAICDVDPAKLAKFAKYNVPGFSSHKEMLSAGVVDAIIICTPHYDHPPIAMDAFDKNVHVLSEKPIAVSVNAARKLNEAYAAASARNPKLKFGIMFQLRTMGIYSKLRDLVADGELGEISRMTWIATDWFRTWTYYASGGWRATWSGEGGGVLINQCPHNMDLIQWITGMMPTRVTAVASIGKTHPIEVEDEVSAILQFPNGATGHFITTTGEAPGSNRLEIAGDRGKIVADNGKLTFFRTRKSVRKTLETSPDSFVSPETWQMEIPYPNSPADLHKTVTTSFVKSINTNSPMIAQGIEGVRGLELGNAMLMSGVLQKSVELPLDGETYDEMLRDLTKKYGGKKTLQTKSNASADLASSYAKQ